MTGRSHLSSIISKAHRFVKRLEPWALVLAVLFFMVERIDRMIDLEKQETDRQYDRVVNSWQLLNAKSSGNSGKTQALEYLHSIGTPMVGLDLTGAYLGDLKYSKGHFVNSTLVNTVLYRADLSNASLSFVDFTDAELNDANMKGVNVSASTFSGAILSGVNLENSDLSYNDFEGVQFSGSNLKNSDLSNANLRNARFNGFGPLYTKAAVLNGANLTNANLAGADLSKVNLSNTVLDGACGDFNTLLPERVVLFKTCDAADQGGEE